MDTLKEIISTFCKKYELDYYENFQIQVIDSISEYIKNDDSEYFHNIQDQIKNIYGLLYEDSNKQWLMLVKEQDYVNFLSSLLHEYVHFCDYKKFSEFRDNISLRYLQKDYVFLFWTEFHATYLVYRFLIDMGSAEIQVKDVENEIVAELADYYSSALKLDKAEAMDKTVRSYGSYLALYDSFCNTVALYPKGYYYSKDFLEVYNFLMNHKTYNEFIVAYDNFAVLLNRI